ncbi:copper chaperone for superoxide dismutase-like [Amphiura filiformis]|uniref:copper chaperone for superoxide dismutase-like n=1 Tax=Amphiura filiformis TaxID=82378 RepID=UPI003B2185DB
MEETPSKVELAVQMTCQSCVDAVKSSLDGVQGIKSVSINLAQEQVIVESTLPTAEIQDLIEATGRRVVIKGQGTATTSHLGAAVVQLELPGPVMGVIRMVQATQDSCVIDGTIDGLTPHGKHGLNIHEYGDLSQACNSCGDHYNPMSARHGGPLDAERHAGDLGNVTAEANGRARFRIVDNRIKVWDVIGRSMVVHSREDDLGKGNMQTSAVDGNSGPGIACGIIARASGLFENEKKICQCDGVSLWNERDVPSAGPSRSQYAQPQQSQL